MAGRILIADDIATNRILLQSRLSEAHYEVVALRGRTDIAQAIRDDRPDLAIVDAEFSGGHGLDICRAVKSDAGLRGLPVILVTRDGDADTGIAALTAGVDEFLTKPLDEVTLLARVRSLLRARDTQSAIERRRETVEELGFAEPPALFDLPPRIVIVARDARGAERCSRDLRRLVAGALDVHAEAEALDAADLAPAPDLFLIDADLSRPRAGLTLLSDLRSRAGSRHAAIVLRHDPGDADVAAMALDLGANDIAREGCAAAELAARLRTQIQRKRDADRLRASVENGLRLAVIDPLTGLYNRRYALRHLSRMSESAAAAGTSFAVLMADVDRFKSINDRFGHAAGDMVLVEIARRLRDNLRDVDLVARFGGEEFLVAIPDTDGPRTARTAERLRDVVGGTPILLPAGHVRTATVSIGIALSRRGDYGPADPQEVVGRADRALYAAKAGGRNTVTMDRTAA